MSIRYCVALAAVCSLVSAAEHRGIVKFGPVPLPGATVTATGGGKQFTTITDQQGNYSFPDLPDGTWKIRVEMLCFAPLERQVAVAPAATASEWDLKLLPFDQIVASAPVPAQAPEAAPPQQADKPRRNRQQPANTPSAFQRTDLNASADSPQAEAAAPDPPGEFSQSPSDGFLINGSVNNGLASPFAQAGAFGNYRPGRRSLYNGSLGLIFGNSFWDARAFSLTGQDTPKPAYTRAQGLLSFGGPLKIPRLIPRDGPNVTLNYQWTRNRNATTSTARVPTAAERRGDFSQPVTATGRPVIVTDPDSGAPFAGNMVPAVPNRPSGQGAAWLLSGRQLRKRPLQLPDSARRLHPSGRPAIARQQGHRLQELGFGSVRPSERADRQHEPVRLPRHHRLNRDQHFRQLEPPHQPPFVRKLERPVQPPVQPDDSVLREPAERLGPGGHYGKQPGAGELGAARPDLLERHRDALRRAEFPHAQPDERRFGLALLGATARTMSLRARISAGSSSTCSRSRIRAGAFTFTGAVSGQRFRRLPARESPTPARSPSATPTSTSAPFPTTATSPTTGAPARRSP